MNLFSEEELVEEQESGTPEFVKVGDGSYIIIVRFRNQEDYYKFLDLIGQPKLKVYNKTKIKETVWPEVLPENNLFEMQL